MPIKVQAQNVSNIANVLELAAREGNPQTAVVALRVKLLVATFNPNCLTPARWQAVKAGIQAGQPLELPYVQYNGVQQSAEIQGGRHRIYALDNMGVAVVPVISTVRMAHSLLQQYGATIADLSAAYTFPGELKERFMKEGVRLMHL